MLRKFILNQEISIDKDSWEDLTQKDRNWICPQCKTEHDRDQNAAVNIKNLGLYTLRIRGSEREVKNRTSIQDYFQAIGIKR